jgi:hypothetical protein
MGIVNNTVTDSIRDSRITDNFMSAGYKKLGYKHRKSSSMSILKDFQQGETILCIKRLEAEIVNDNDIQLLYFSKLLEITPVRPG